MVIIFFLLHEGTYVCILGDNFFLLLDVVYVYFNVALVRPFSATAIATAIFVPSSI